ncbi:hypothetical protein LEMLEM_LOCUS23926 [Lemmus lemmus]
MPLHTRGAQKTGMYLFIYTVPNAYSVFPTVLLEQNFHVKLQEYGYYGYASKMEIHPPSMTQHDFKGPPLGPGPASASCGGATGHQQLAGATCSTTSSSPPPFPPSRPRTATSSPTPPSPPLWCLEPGGGSDPQQLTQLGHCLSHSPQDTPWAQRLVCGTLATTQAAAPATLNYLPDHYDNLPKPSPPPAGDSTRGKAVPTED